MRLRTKHARRLVLGPPKMTYQRLLIEAINIQNAQVGLLEDNRSYDEATLLFEAGVEAGLQRALELLVRVTGR